MQRKKKKGKRKSVTTYRWEIHIGKCGDTLQCKNICATRHVAGETATSVPSQRRCTVMALAQNWRRGWIEGSALSCKPSRFCHKLCDHCLVPCWLLELMMTRVWIRIQMNVICLIWLQLISLRHQSMRHYVFWRFCSKSQPTHPFQFPQYI